METAILTRKKTFTLHGLAKPHDPNKEYSATIFALLDQVWQEVREKKLSHMGINYVVYDAGHMVFAGIELIPPLAADLILRKRELILQKYAYYKHIGPYSELAGAYDRIHSAVRSAGERHEPPALEIYGHWSDDPAKLETEILLNLI